MRTRMSGGVGAGRAILPATRFDEPDITSNPLETWGLWKVRVQEINEIRVEMTVMDSDVDAIRVKRLKIKHVSKVREARKALKASVICRVESSLPAKPCE